MLRDIRWAFRLFRRTPALSAIAVLSTALGVSAASVVFTAVNAVLIRPLPYARPAELVQVRTDIANAGQSDGDWVFWNDTQEIVRRTRTLASIAIYGNAVFDLGGSGSNPPEALYGLRMSAGLFPTLGVSPMLGRNLLAGEDKPGGANVMILSYGLWNRRFNADRGVIGRHVKINGADCLVIGVMPPDFDFPLSREAARTPHPYVEFWAPLRIDAGSSEGALGAVARLRPGVSLVQAQQDLASISTDLQREFPATNRDRTLHLAFLKDRVLREAGSALWLVMGAAFLFLVVGCANVANLLLARGVFRHHEIAVRMALGAGSARIVQQLFTESSVLAVLGGFGGYVLTAAAWTVLPAVTPAHIPRLAQARPDQAVLLFALLVAAGSGILFGTVPALSAARGSHPAAGRTLGVRGASRKVSRIGPALVAAEVAVAVVLVVLGGQLLGSFIALIRTDPGFEANRISASVVLPARERYKTPEQRRVLYGRFLDAVRALPGVESAGTVDALPFSGENHGGFITADQAAIPDPSRQKLAEIDVIGGDYLQTMGIRLAAGRWFYAEEMSRSSDAAIVNDIAAKRLWPGASAIGKRLCVDCTPEKPANWKRVVGVVSTIHHAALDESAEANVYLSGGALEQAAFLVVRTARPSAGLEQAMRRAVAAVDPDQPILLSASMQSLIADSVASRQFIVSLLAITGCLALLMSVAGVYGVMSYTASRRTQELGIRMALGATRVNIHVLLFGQGFVTVLIGLGLGVSSALALTHALRGRLLGLDSGGTVYMGFAAGLVALTAAVACWVPARRATQIDPMSALRQD